MNINLTILFLSLTILFVSTMFSIQIKHLKKNQRALMDAVEANQDSILLFYKELPKYERKQK